MCAGQARPADGCPAGSAGSTYHRGSAGPANRRQRQRQPPLDRVPRQGGEPLSSTSWPAGIIQGKSASRWQARRFHSSCSLHSYSTTCGALLRAVNAPTQRKLLRLANYPAAGERFFELVSGHSERRQLCKPQYMMGAATCADSVLQCDPMRTPEGRCTLAPPTTRPLPSDPTGGARITTESA
jgi:hypothetical protein